LPFGREQTRVTQVGVKLLIPDTNFWIDAKRPVDFPALARGEPFTVVVPRTVLGELDDHAHDGRPSVRKRARRTQRELGFINDAGTSTGDRIVGMDAANNPYWFVLDAPGPDNASNDDKIVRTAANLRSDGTPTIVTSDGAMRMTARLAGVAIIQPADDLLEPDETDSIEQKVSSLERKVQKLEQPQALDVDVSAEVLFPKDDAPELVRVDQPSVDQLNILRSQVQVRLAFNDPAYAPNQAIQMYNASVPPHAVRVADYLEACARWEAMAEAAVYVQLILVNRTTTPVQDAVLELRAPQGVTFLYPPARPQPPAPLPRPSELVDRPPQRPVSPMMAQIASIAQMAQLTRPTIPSLVGIAREPIPGAPRVRVEEKWIECRLGEPLRPDHRAFAGKAWVCIEPEFPDNNLEIPYVLFAATAGKPVNGTVRILVRHRHEAWSPPSLPSRENPAIGTITRGSQHERWLKKDGLL
jgi:hypothetical protein